MIEDIFLKDLRLRGVEVLRSTPFLSYEQKKDGNSAVEVECVDLKTGRARFFNTQYLVGCDGAHSKVRKVMLGPSEHGGSSKSAWGVLDGEFIPTPRTKKMKLNCIPGVIETDFPDRWSKAVISSETAGSILCIPRESNMTRLYIELHPAEAPISSDASTEEFVMWRAKEIMKPFKLSWKTVGELLDSESKN